jgi:hypothetical protein
MSCRQSLCAKLARKLGEIIEFDCLVAVHARDGRLATQIARGEFIDHRLPETRLIIEHVMRYVEARRHTPRVMNILACAACPLAPQGFPMIVKLEGDAHHVIACKLEKPGDHGGIDATRHGDNHPRARKIAAKVHGRSDVVQNMVWQLHVVPA